ncbi:unnamed protein product [Cylicocyclus nassatus]|nr:unnamed protein product [Cylicocyclus nassatus]
MDYRCNFLGLTAMIEFVMQVCGLPAVSFQKIIEVVIRNESRLTREIVRHLNHVEERVLEELAWTKDSALNMVIDTNKYTNIHQSNELWLPADKNAIFALIILIVLLVFIYILLNKKLILCGTPWTTTNTRPRVENV